VESVPEHLVSDPNVQLIWIEPRCTFREAATQGDDLSGFCEQCGGALSDGAKFCAACGAQVQVKASTASSDVTANGESSESSEATAAQAPYWPPPSQPKPEASSDTTAAAQPVWPPQPAGAPQPAQPAGASKNWFRRHKVLTAILGLLVLIVIIAAAAGGSSNKNATNGNNSAAPNNPTTVASTPTAAPASKPVTPKPSLTGPQQQAVEAAQNYLSIGSGFSRSGLIKQLSSSYGSGFPNAVAVFAVNHLDPDWNQQAVIAAKDYKQTGGGFSCSGMIQQLSSSYGSGFTHAQAVYGARQAGVC
jgi:hypothetical protein